MKGYVFVNGRGLVKFKSKEKKERDCFDQYRGKIKHPNIGLGKWVKYDFWFDEGQVFSDRYEAMDSICDDYIYIW